jgi:hypothetical protein
MVHKCNTEFTLFFFGQHGKKGEEFFYCSGNRDRRGGGGRVKVRQCGTEATPVAMCEKRRELDLHRLWGQV